MQETSNGITKESFSKLSNTSKLDILFDYTVQTHQRLEKLEKRKYYDKFMSGVAGVVAALGVVVTKSFFWRN